MYGCRGIGGKIFFNSEECSILLWDDKLHQPIIKITATIGNIYMLEVGNKAIAALE